MKKGILIALFLFAAAALVCPEPGYSHGSWYIPGAFLGGALFGAAIARPAYVAPPPAYAYPPPAYAYPAPVYAYPYYGPRY